jgi:RNA polymerase sigma-70 factor (ECF subfamily)
VASFKVLDTLNLAQHASVNESGAVNPENDSNSASADAHQGVFVTTRWSVVLKAGCPDPIRSRAALEQLCRAYWHPLYHYVRRRGYRPEDAQDLTQSFFERLLERDALAKADPDRGRFRSFLLTSLKHFLSDEWDKMNARKRGGGQPVLSLDFETEERRLTIEPADPLTPEKVFEQRWAIALLDQVYRRLETEFANQGKRDQFAALRVTLTAPRGTTPYAELARGLGIREGAVKVAVHRLRQRYRELLRETIADTVAGPEEVDDELRHLLQVLAG